MTKLMITFLIRNLDTVRDNRASSTTGLKVQPYPLLETTTVLLLSIAKVKTPKHQKERRVQLRQNTTSGPKKD